MTQNTDLQTQINALQRQPIPAQKLYIDGEWRAAEGEKSLVTSSPIDGQNITEIARASVGDVDRAVAAARRSFAIGEWSRISPQNRKNILLRWALLIEQNATSITVQGVRDNGTEFNMAYKGEVMACVQCLRFYAEAIDKFEGRIAVTDPQRIGLIQPQPVGVVAAIVPWNFPLSIGAWKIAPALAMGNTVILKPSEQASLSWLAVAKLADEAGLPAGVFNLVTGKGSEVGAYLAKHNDVDILAFTGGEHVGRKLHQYVAQSNLKKLYLELGGKSPNIVFDDCGNKEAVVRHCVNAIFRNSGQVCVSGSRLLIQNTIYKEVIDILVGMTQKLKVGNPLCLDNQIGAVCGAEKLKENLDFIAVAERESLQLLSGGRQLLEHSGGYYMQPTIFGNVPPQSPLFQEELFAPILTVTAFADEKEAIALANNSKFGLAAGVWSQNNSRVHRLFRAIDAGVVHINCYGGTSITVPMGGMKQSGNGYDRSLLALEKYCHYKTGWIAID